MRFADPLWLFVGAACVAGLVLVLARAEVLRSRALALLAGTRLSQSFAALPSRLRRWLRVGVISFAVAMGFVALARPQRGMQWETITRKGTDLLLVVDTSRSMDADDIKPTRLERSKLAIRDLVEKFPGDRIGLVAFAGDAFVQSPMTLDHAALMETVDALDSSVVARGGTNVGRAIDVAANALATEPDHQKSIVLITDGEDLEGQGIAEAKRAGDAGIIIDTVGVGSAAGELVPMKDNHGRATGIVRDEEGRPVRSHLDETSLRAIADAAHGSYRPLGADGGGLARLYDEALAPRAHIEASSRTHRVYHELFEVPLALALGGIVLDALLGVAWRRSRSKSRVMAAATTAAAFLLLPHLAHASVGAAQKAYAAGHFDEAEKQYAAESAKSPKDAMLAFDEGDAAYKAGHYAAADAAFKRALQAGSPKQQQQVLYNEGNALYRTGEHAPAESTAEKKDAWKAAITAYDGALALTPGDADAQFNRDFVKRKLAELEKKEQEQQEKKKDQESKPDNKNGNAKGKQDSNGKDKNGNAPASQAENGKDKNGNQSHGAPQPASQPPGGQTPGEADNEKPAPGAKLDPREARALLGAVKGEERHSVLRSADAGAAADDAPRKDW